VTWEATALSLCLALVWFRICFYSGRNEAILWWKDTTARRTECVHTCNWRTWTQRNPALLYFNLQSHLIQLDACLFCQPERGENNNNKKPLSPLKSHCRIYDRRIRVETQDDRWWNSMDRPIRVETHDDSWWNSRRVRMHVGYEEKGHYTIVQRLWIMTHLNHENRIKLSRDSLWALHNNT